MILDVPVSGASALLCPFLLPLSISSSGASPSRLLCCSQQSGLGVEMNFLCTCWLLRGRKQSAGPAKGCAGSVQRHFRCVSLSHSSLRASWLQGDGENRLCLLMAEWQSQRRRVCGMRDTAWPTLENITTVRRCRVT